MQRPLLIIDNHDSFTYNLVQWLQADVVDDVDVRVCRNDAITLGELLNLNPSGLVLSPGPGHPTNPADLGVCHDILTNIDRIPYPILGVCLGMQALAAYSGASITQSPNVVHGKPSMIQQSGESVLFKGLPDTFEAMRYHSWIVDETTLPTEWEITGRTVATESEPSLLMAIEHKIKKHAGVQFHPESIGTPHGRSILRNFLVYSDIRMPAQAEQSA